MEQNIFSPKLYENQEELVKDYPYSDYMSTNDKNGELRENSAAKMFEKLIGFKSVNKTMTET